MVQASSRKSREENLCDLLCESAPQHPSGRMDQVLCSESAVSNGPGNRYGFFASFRACR